MWWYNHVFRIALPIKIFISYLSCRRIYDVVQPGITFSSEVAYSCTIRELCNYTTRLHNADPPHFWPDSLHAEAQQLTFVGFRASNPRWSRNKVPGFDIRSPENRSTVSFTVRLPTDGSLQSLGAPWGLEA